MLFHLHCAGGLQSLGLAGCGGVSDIGLARIARSAPRLTSLVRGVLGCMVLRCAALCCIA